MIFNSNINIAGEFRKDWSLDTLKNEPMFFNCDLDFAWEHGGPITREFIFKLPSNWMDENPVLDSRVHMLMKNWYPCIPGWHHDDVPRSTTTGQPNYINPEYHSEHLCGLINAEICPTLFAIGQIEVSEPNINIKQYNVWHHEIENISNIEKYKAESGKYIEFDRNAFHTGTKAESDGWRWFARLSKNTDRQKHITNEIRRQVQVYLENPVEGW